ncbi:MAG: GGDEF domain-containing protein [Oscillospiraceae bacterium]
MKVTYTVSELLQTIDTLQDFFNIVRIVDPTVPAICNFSEDEAIFYTEYTDICVSSREQPSNSTSLIALIEKSTTCKFEFSGDEIYITSQYIEVNNNKLILELVNKIDNNVIVDCCATSSFAEKICEYNQRLYIDPVTKAYNRLYLNEHLLYEVVDAVSTKQELCLAMIDVDEFKSVNDAFGHRLGDNVLTRIVSLIKKNISISRGDFVARYGGDEFVLVQKGMTKENFNKRLKKILDEVEALTFSKNIDVKITISIGCAFLTDLENFTEEELIHKADINLYRAKEMGKNCIVIQ